MHLRKSDQRGLADHGWLRSRHTFSFARFYDPAHMGFGHLRVINQDVVAPGQGFGTHPHRDMEILSYVVRGALEHRDTLGTGSVIRPGEVQLMSAGRGIAHSEYNASADAPVEFLQIWILPSERGGAPAYQQRAFDTAARGLTRVVGPDGGDGALAIKQDMELHRLLLDDGQEARHPLARDRGWVQLVRGALVVNGVALRPGDGLAVEGGGELAFRAEGEVEALVFDLQ